MEGVIFEDPNNQHWYDLSCCKSDPPFYCERHWSFQSNFFDLLSDYLLGAIQQLREQKEGGQQKVHACPLRGVPWMSMWTRIKKKIQLFQKVFHTIALCTRFVTTLCIINS